MDRRSNKRAFVYLVLCPDDELSLTRAPLLCFLASLLSSTWVISKRLFRQWISNWKTPITAIVNQILLWFEISIIDQFTWLLTIEDGLNFDTEYIAESRVVPRCKTKSANAEFHPKSARAFVFRTSCSLGTTQRTRRVRMHSRVRWHLRRFRASFHDKERYAQPPNTRVFSGEKRDRAQERLMSCGSIALLTCVRRNLWLLTTICVCVYVCSAFLFLLRLIIEFLVT